MEEPKQMRIKCYGVRGSLPSPLTALDVRGKILQATKLALLEKPKDVESWVDELPFDIGGTFGGNTTCILVQCGEINIVLDLGSGLRQLGNDLLIEMFKRKGMPIYFLTSHVHWDHVQGFPFFAPLFISQKVLPGNHFKFFGGTRWKETLEEVLRGQMDPPTFPVEFNKIVSEGPKLSFDSVFNGFSTEIIQGEYEREDTVKITAARLNHPDETYGYRIEYNGKVFVFASDTEPFPGGPDPVILGLAKDADLLYIDGQYSEDQYLGKPTAGGVFRGGWGHGTEKSCAEAAKAAKVGALFIGHHDPASTDMKIMENVARAQAIFPYTFGAYDGLEIFI